MQTNEFLVEGRVLLQELKKMHEDSFGFRNNIANQSTLRLAKFSDLPQGRFERIFLVIH
jgi:hypothetical protein